MNPYIALSTALLSDHRLIDADCFTTYVRGLLYAKTHQTDGFVPFGAIPLVTLGVTRESQNVVTNLVTKGLWEECEGGYTVGREKWAKWQDTKEDDEKRREAARLRKRQQREREMQKLAQITTETKKKPVTKKSRVSHSGVTRESRPNRREELYSSPLPPSAERSGGAGGDTEVEEVSENGPVVRRPA